jgi:transketolase
MWRTVVDTKQGKVWANHPQDQHMMIVADVEEDADKYLKWNEMIAQIRTAPPEKVEFFYNVMVKKFEEMFDKKFKASDTIKSDRGNPTDL